MRHKRTRDIVIELTSLLDVVMILIFAVMIENSKLTQATQGKLEDANTQIEAMQEEMDNLSVTNEKLQSMLDKVADGDTKALVNQLQQDESLLDAYDYMDEVASVINISLENKNGNRILTFGLSSDKESGKTYIVEKRDSLEWDKSINQLKIFIQEALATYSEDANTDRMTYLIFSADYTNVYANDFDTIEKILIAAANDNDEVVYHSNNLNNEEKSEE